MRSKWKLPFKLEPRKIQKWKIKKRNESIYPLDIGQTYMIYNGFSYHEVQINKEMLGRKFGEFVLTKKISKHEKRNNNKRGH